MSPSGAVDVQSAKLLQLWHALDNAKKLPQIPEIFVSRVCLLFVLPGGCLDHCVCL